MHSSRPLATAVGALAAAITLLAGLAVLGTEPAAAADDAPWTVQTSSNEFGSERPNYSYTLNPGGQLADGLVIANQGTTPLDLALYAADAFTTDAGQLDLVTKGTTSTGVGAWVHAGRDRVTIQPGKSVEVPFTLTLPANAGPGDHVGGIVTSLTQAGVERRVALRIRLRVGGELKPALSVEKLHLDSPGTLNPFGKSDATLSYTIHNTGNAVLAARQSASVSGPFGRLRANAGQVADSPPLLPGESWKVSVPVHGVASSVPLTGTVTLVPLLADAAGSIAPLTAVDTAAHSWPSPWALLILFLVLCGLVVVVLASRRRSKSGAPVQTPRAQETSQLTH